MSFMLEHNASSRTCDSTEESKESPVYMRGKMAPNNILNYCQKSQVKKTPLYIQYSLFITSTKMLKNDKYKNGKNNIFTKRHQDKAKAKAAGSLKSIAHLSIL